MGTEEGTDTAQSGFDDVGDRGEMGVRRRGKREREHTQDELIMKKHVLPARQPRSLPLDLFAAQLACLPHLYAQMPK